MIYLKPEINKTIIQGGSMKRLLLICFCILIAIPAWAKGPQKTTDIENTIQAYEEIVARYGDIEKMEPALKQFENTQDMKDE